MSDQYFNDRNRFRYRYYPEDDAEREGGGYGRQPDPGRDYGTQRPGRSNRDMENERARGVSGRGSDYDRPDFGQNRGFTDWRDQYRFDPTDNDRGNVNRWRDYDRGSFGRGSDFARGNSNPSQGQYGYNRGFGTQWDRDTDFDTDFGFEPESFTYTEFWLIPGPETGRGPQGFQRSDERIYEDICDRMMQHGRLDASNVTVQVNHGEVTLTGNVKDRQSKRTAEGVAESVAGVTDIHNQVKVNQEKNRVGQQQEHHESQI